MLTGAKVQHFRYNNLNGRALYVLFVMIQKPLESNRKKNHNHRLMLKRMRGMYRNPLLLLGSLFSCLSASAQFTKYSNEFLNIGAGARGMSMAGAQVASVSDGTAGYWNPAALADIRNAPQLNLMHAEYYAGIGKYDFGNLVLPMKDNNGRWALPSCGLRWMISPILFFSCSRMER